MFQFAHRRRWLLKLLAEGMRRNIDFYVCERRHIFRLLLSMYNSSLFDQQSKVSEYLTERCAICSSWCYSLDFLSGSRPSDLNSCFEITNRRQEAGQILQFHRMDSRRFE